MRESYIRRIKETDEKRDSLAPDDPTLTLHQRDLIDRTLKFHGLYEAKTKAFYPDTGELLVSLKVWLDSGDGYKFNRFDDYVAGLPPSFREPTMVVDQVQRMQDELQRLQDEVTILRSAVLGVLRR